MRSFSKSEIRIIKSIFSLENPTRTAIARETRLSLVKISSILNILENKRCIRKAGKTKTKGGRPSYIFQLQPEIGCSIGVLLELESFRIVVIDFSKTLIYDEVFALKLSSDQDSHIRNIVDQVSAKLDKVIGASFSEKKSIISIGLALPGMVDTQRKIWLQGLQLTGITHVHIATELQNRFKIPIFIEDNARALTYIEKLKGFGKGINNFVLIYLGLGMGTGIVIDNKIYRGFHGIAGEIGHIIHADNTYRCSCNNVGCLETVVSAPGILRVFKDRLNEGVISTLQKCNTQGGDYLTIEKILAAALEGDRLAQSTLFETGRFLGEACSILIKLFNPQRLIISGYVSIFKDFFREPVHQVINQRVIPEMLTDFEILFTEYSSNQEACGAALLALDNLLTESLNGGWE